MTEQQFWQPLYREFESLGLFVYLLIITDLSAYSNERYERLLLGAWLPPYKFEKKSSWMPALKYDIFGLVAAASMIPRSWWSCWYSCCSEARISAEAKETQNGTYLCNTIIKILRHSLYNPLHLPENLEPRESTFDFGSWEGVFEDTMSTPLVFYCFFNIYICCIRVHSIIGLRPQTTWSYINYALRDACSALCWQQRD